MDDIDASMKRLLNWNNKLKNYWKASPYFLEDTNSKIQMSERQRLDVERFSDWQKTLFTRDSLSQVLEFKDFPKELTQDSPNRHMVFLGKARRMSKRKNFLWNPESDLKALDFFEQLEKKAQIKVKKKRKKGKMKMMMKMQKMRRARKNLVMMTIIRMNIWTMMKMITMMWMRGKMKASTKNIWKMIFCPRF
ncbi:uncharacterized protein LOC129285469 [Prosopis cineraria]|uniref:uncharacterized protein LOC129285469 n=1 Tax=Prosopis cineraria TaxID=364024 RepID=UPI0024100BB5|nr:uncharacterized protein LOC129285469 [Prosopis cineraria]